MKNLIIVIGESMRYYDNKILYEYGIPADTKLNLLQISDIIRCKDNSVKKCLDFCQTRLTDF